MAGTVTTPAPGTAPRIRYQPALDGVRALAVVAVLLFHAGVPGFDGGYLGVSVFFTLSGYLITSLLIALAVGSAVVFTYFISERIALQAAEEDLSANAQLQDTFREQRLDQLYLTASLFVNDPSLAAYVAEAIENADSDSILDLIASRQGDLGYDFAVVLDTGGTVLARTDRPGQVGWHSHFAEANPALGFVRAAARGHRLDIAAGTAVRFEPGQRREVRLIPYAGARRVFGFNAQVMGPL